MEEFTVKAEKIVSGGNCLCHIDGKAVFVPYAIPEEILCVEITKKTRDWNMAKIKKILEPSSHRTEPFCPLYGICGGCNMQHIDSDFQKEIRKKLLLENFERAGVFLEDDVDVIFGENKGYRARIRLSDGGFYQKGSHSVIGVDFCPVATKEINEWLSKNPFESRPKGSLKLFADKRVKNASHIAISKENAQKSGHKKARFSGTVGGKSFEENKCELEILKKTLAFDVRGFFQSNLDVLEKSIAHITGKIKGFRALDVYAGVGTFSAFLSDNFDFVTLVEHNRDALVYAEQNLAGKKHESYGLPASLWAKRNAKNAIAFDAAVIDPPREGIERDTLDWFCKESKIPVIQSVSCDSATHARDVSKLIKAGYTLKKLTLLDFYPQTAHTESLAELELK